MRGALLLVENVSVFLSRQMRTKFLKKTPMNLPVRHFTKHDSHYYCISPTSGKLSKTQAKELTLRLSSEERKILLYALQEYESKQVKDEYEGQLAATRWRSKFGRPSKIPKLGDVDPTGSYCQLPDDWLQKKYAASVPPPTSAELTQLIICNAIPFIGFGFLDNFIMIVAGDRIELALGSYITLTTMAAAALGNTISDVIGIGSAYYVERAALAVGITPPKLSPIQLDMAVCHRASNMGRVFGIIIGCMLGMFPLLFIKESGVKKVEAEHEILSFDVSISADNIEQSEEKIVNVEVKPSS